MTIRHIDVNPRLNGVITDDQLQAMYHSYQPIGNGPIGLMRTICEILEALAHERGVVLEDPQGVYKSE